MAQTAWNPFREMEEMLDRYGRGTGRPVQARRGDGHEVMTTADWAPVVDISETASEYLIKAELPEVDKNNVKISVNTGVLLIEGERDFQEEEGRKFHRVERSFGRFARSFTLPDNVEEGKIKAEHQNGLLLLHLPKHEQPKPKSIEIKVH